MTRMNLPRSPKGLAAIPGQRQVDAQALAMIVALASETVVLRARLDTCERLLVAANLLAPDAIDTFSPGESAQAERNRLRTQSLRKIFRPLQEGAEADLLSFSDVNLLEKSA